MLKKCVQILIYEKTHKTEENKTGTLTNHITTKILSSKSNTKQNKGVKPGRVCI